MSNRPLGLRIVLASAIALAGCSGVAPEAPELAHIGQQADAEVVSGDFESAPLIGSGGACNSTTQWCVTLNQNTNGINYPPASTTDLQLQPANGNTLVRTWEVPVGGATAETQIPYGLTSADTLRIPKFGRYAAVVNLGGTGQNQGKDGNVNTLTQSLVMTPADVDRDGLIHVRFSLAPVLENPNRTDTQQPYFWVTVKNITQGTTLFHTFNFANEANVAWKTSTGGATPVSDRIGFHAIFILAPRRSASATRSRFRPLPRAVSPLATGARCIWTWWAPCCAASASTSARTFAPTPAPIWSTTS